MWDQSVGGAGSEEAGTRGRTSRRGSSGRGRHTHRVVRGKGASKEIPSVLTALIFSLPQQQGHKFKTKYILPCI